MAAVSVDNGKSEFSDLFKQFFEDCPPELEKSLSIPINLPPAAHRAVDQGSVLLHGHSSNTLLLNLDPNRFPDLCKTVAGDFYGHTRNKSDYSVQKVHILRNPVNWRRYQAEKILRQQLAKKENKGEGIYRDEVLFHGTHRDKVSSILLNGLDPRTTVRANYGKGIYFSDTIEKCMQYVEPQTTLNQEYSIVLCCVLLGRVKVEAFYKQDRKLNPETMFLPEGYDSAVVQDVFKEWIVYEKSQILPLCVIHFTATNDPRSFFRLSSHKVLFGGQSVFPTNMDTIQPICNVATPASQQSRKAELPLPEWKVPDTDKEDILFAILDIPRGTAQIRPIEFPALFEWAVTAKNTKGEQVYFYFDNKDLRGFVDEANRIIERTKDLDKVKERNAAEQATRQTALDQELTKVFDGETLIAGLRSISGELGELEAEGNSVKVALERYRAQAVQQMGPGYVQSYDYQLAVHPWQSQLSQLQQAYDAKMASLGVWNREHIGIAIGIIRMQDALERLKQDHLLEEDRLRLILGGIKHRSYADAFRKLTWVTLENLDRRLQSAQIQRQYIGSLPTGVSSDMVFHNTEVTTVTTRIWPQLVAELIMPPVMIRKVALDKVGWLCKTTPQDVPKILTEGFKGFKGWWDTAGELTFGVTLASAQFWPVLPENRLPNRPFFMLTNYIEWMFQEKEIRFPRADLRQQKPGTLSRLVSKVDPLKGAELQELFRSEWGNLDPTILAAIRGLPSRFGTVVFDRKTRQEEVDRLGADLIDALFVPAEAHMLILDEEPATAKSTAVSSATKTTGTPTTKIKASSECPICQEALEIPDTNSQADPKPEVEKVVKLKSCRHCFHETCIKEWFHAKDSQLKCPMCNTMCTSEGRAGATKGAFGGEQAKLGPCPDAVMGYSFDPRLCCYFIYITIPAHTIPHPTRPQETIPIKSDIRYATIPFTARLGPLLLIRLITLFYYGHLFRVGHSLTRGVDNVVVWNGVHLRTAMTGQFGFPATGHELACWREINQKGIAMGLEKLLLDVSSVPPAEIKQFTPPLPADALQRIPSALSYIPGSSSLSSSSPSSTAFSQQTFSFTPLPSTTSRPWLTNTTATTITTGGTQLSALSLGFPSNFATASNVTASPLANVPALSSSSSASASSSTSTSSVVTSPLPNHVAEAPFIFPGLVSDEFRADQATYEAFYERRPCVFRSS